MIGPVKTRYHVVFLVVGREQVVTQAEVQGQPRRHAPAVLKVGGVFLRSRIEQTAVQLVVVVPKAEIEIGKLVAGERNGLGVVARGSRIVECRAVGVPTVAARPLLLLW